MAVILSRKVLLFGAKFVMKAKGGLIAASMLYASSPYLRRGALTLEATVLLDIRAKSSD